MKTANVVEVRDRGPLLNMESDHRGADERRMDRMADLLRRYPAIDESERAELLHFLKKGAQLEVGLVSAREGMAARLMAFRSDHAAEFRLRPVQVLGFVALVLLPIMALVWACFG